jgi:hypothetical protein
VPKRHRLLLFSFWVFFYFTYFFNVAISRVNPATSVTPTSFLQGDLINSYSFSYLITDVTQLYIPYSLSLSSFYSFCAAGDWAKGLSNARQVLYHLSHTSSPFVCLFVCFWDRVSLTLLGLASNLRASYLHNPVAAHLHSGLDLYIKCNCILSTLPWIVHCKHN